MSTLTDLLASARAELPQEISARWASLFFSLAVLCFLLSIAASQAFLAAAGAAYAVHLLRARPAVHFPPLKLPLVLFCLGTVLSVLAAANPGAGWFAVRKLVLFLILLLGANLILTRKHLEFLFRGLFLESALAGIVALGQFGMQYGAVRSLSPEQIYAHLTSQRISGFMGHWMNFGGQQMLVFAALSAFLLFFPAPKRIWWAAWGTVAASIFFNFTRGVWLGCFAAAIYLVARWKARLLWTLPVVLLVGYLAAPSLVRKRLHLALHPSADPSLAIRFEMWGVALRMMREHPWLGVGPNNIEEVYLLYLPPDQPPIVGYHEHFHNNFFQLGAERGLPVLAAWVWLMTALGWHFVRIRRRLAAARGTIWLVEGVIAGWLAFLVEGCFEFNFGTSPVLMLFLFMATTPFILERVEPAGEVAAKAGSRRPDRENSLGS